MGKFVDAREQFEIVSRRAPKSQFYYLSQLYLIQIAIEEEKFAQADKLLNTFLPQLSQEDKLLYALAFLRGEMAYCQKDYAQAIQSLENAIPKHNPEKAEWYRDTLYLLGMSYIKESESPFTASSSSSIEKGLAVLQKLIDSFPSDQTYLAL